MTSTLYRLDLTPPPRGMGITNSMIIKLVFNAVAKVSTYRSIRSNALISLLRKHTAAGWVHFRKMIHVHAVFRQNTEDVSVSNVIATTGSYMHRLVGSINDASTKWHQVVYILLMCDGHATLIDQTVLIIRNQAQKASFKRFPNKYQRFNRARFS